MSRFKDILLFTGSANPGLASAISRTLDIPLGKMLLKRFSDGEIWVEVNENVRQRDAYIIQPTGEPANENLMELLIIIDALKRASVDTITAVIPYYGYARQDRKAQPRVPITAKLVADLLTAAGTDRVVSIDLHAGQIQGFFNIPFDHIYAMPVFLDYIQTLNFEKPIVVSPDVGGAERARAYARRLGCNIALIDKKRSAPNVSEVMHVVGDVEGCNCLLVDDIIDTAGTLTSAAKTLKEFGAKSVMACCTHPVLSGPAIERIQNSELEKLIVTDTIALRQEKKIDKIKQLTVAGILGKGILRIAKGQSVSSLFV
ncbi:MAG: ribose-phosphate pyrophosphokinase [bacterium]|nr:ribose-phosphate pyrophosphokinase [bacterium]MBU1916498.1 ribose-phosphate pyrophosphokinase [bacterium]